MAKKKSFQDVKADRIARRERLSKSAFHTSYVREYVEKKYQKRLGEIDDWVDYEFREGGALDRYDMDVDFISEEYGEDLGAVISGQFERELVMGVGGVKFPHKLEALKQAGRKVEQIERRDAGTRAELAARGVSSRGSQVGVAKDLLKRNVEEGLSEAQDILRRGDKIGTAMQARADAEEANRRRQEKSHRLGVVGGIAGLALTGGSPAGYAVGSGLGSLAGAED